MASRRLHDPTQSIRYREKLVITRTFHRDNLTWLSYLSLAFYAYFLNVLGPITPFLKEELSLSYTVSSFHFTAFAVGILLIGAGGHFVIQRIGRWRSLWIGMIGISLGAVLLLVGNTAVITIGASFLMGLVGSLILAIVPAALSDGHGELRAIALAEANMLSSIAATAAPLMVGWFAHSIGGWRMALGIVAFTPILLFSSIGRRASSIKATTIEERAGLINSLSTLFWTYWVALVLGVSIEFCMIFWGANYLEQVLGMSKADAAQALSLFLGAMIVGRVMGSQLVKQYAASVIAIISILISSVGFFVFWRTNHAFTGLIGLFTTGLGVANLYPMILSLAIGAADGNTIQASARTTLASGTAILTLPLILGSLADAVGIRSAYSVVVFLLVSVFLICLLAGRKFLSLAN